MSVPVPYTKADGTTGTDLYLSKDGQAAFAADVSVATFPLAAGHTTTLRRGLVHVPDDGCRVADDPVVGIGRRTRQGDPAGMRTMDVQPRQFPQGRRSSRLVTRRDAQPPPDRRQPHRRRSRRHQLTRIIRARSSCVVPVDDVSALTSPSRPRRGPPVWRNRSTDWRHWSRRRQAGRAHDRPMSTATSPATRVAVPRGCRDLDYTEELAATRRAFATDHSGSALDDVGHFSLDPASLPGNIENFVGVAQVPIGLAGPLRIRGEHASGDFYIPLATTEGTLVASYNRGMRLLAECGGVRDRCRRGADAAGTRVRLSTARCRRGRSATGSPSSSRRSRRRPKRRRGPGSSS